MEAAAIFGKHDPAKVGTEQILTICEGKGDAAKDMLVEVFRCVLNCLPTHCLLSSSYTSYSHLILTSHLIPPSDLDSPGWRLIESSGVVRRDGDVLVDQKFAEIRARADVEGGPFSS